MSANVEVHLWTRENVCSQSADMFPGSFDTFKSARICIFTATGLMQIGNKNTEENHNPNKDERGLRW